MLWPHLAHLGGLGDRRLASLGGPLGLQSKAAQGVVKIRVIACLAVILWAQGVAGDVNQFFAGPLM